MLGTLDRIVNKFWYTDNKIKYLLLPFSFIFFLLITVRKYVLKSFFSNRKFKAAIIVVGNINIGGTGKTPLVIYLCKLLKKFGKNPAVITRGYRGKLDLIYVNKNSITKDCGDEAVMLAQSMDFPILVGKNRYKAIKKLTVENPNIDVIVCDDGLQDYSIPKDIEIAVFDGMRGIGNGCLLPIGPLREPAWRLRKTDFVIINKISNDVEGKGLENKVKLENELLKQNIVPFLMELQGANLYNISNKENIKPLTEFKHKKVHVVSAIGNNYRFFNQLRNSDIEIIEHPFPDHYYYKPADFNFNDEYPIIITEKDAVKLREIFLSKENLEDLKVVKKIFVYPVDAKLNKNFDKDFINKLKSSLPLKSRIDSVIDSWNDRV